MEEVERHWMNVEANLNLILKDLEKRFDEEARMYFKGHNEQQKTLAQRRAADLKKQLTRLNNIIENREGWKLKDTRGAPEEFAARPRFRTGAFRVRNRRHYPGRPLPKPPAS